MSDCEDKYDYVCYKDREEWSDLTPIKQNDGPGLVVKIAYSPEFEDAYDYFRGVVAAGELSERALLLTEDCIDFNAANYTVWQYRRQILKHIKADLREELAFCRKMIEGNPKNYQVWHHRRVIIQWLGDCSQELRLTEMIFGQDSKNYHAWEHRQWVLTTYKTYEGELDFIDRLLLNDIRNNSAWNHRYFVYTQTSGLTLEVLKKELIYVQKAICKITDNESPWAYIKGLLRDTKATEEEIEKCWREFEAWCFDLLRKTAKVEEDVSNYNLISNLSQGSISPHLLIGIFDCINYRIENLAPSMKKREALLLAKLICDVLSSIHDTIRTKYWQYINKKLSCKCLEDDYVE